MGSLCGSSPSSTSNTTTAAPQWITDQFQGTTGIANNLANRGPTDLPQQAAPAGMTANQNTGIGGFQAGANAANGTLPQAGANYTLGSAGLGVGANYQPQQVAGATSSGAPAVTAGQFPDANLNSYMDPYLQQVANTSLSNLNRQNQIALSNVGSQAETQGAYGGARQGIAEGETNRGYADTSANLLANLFNTGFGNAQNQINLDQNRALSANQGNQQSTLATNALNAQLAQQASLANQNAGLTANSQQIGASNNLLNGSATGFNNGLAANGALFGAGSAQQALNQQGLNTQFQNAQSTYQQPVNNLNLRLAAQGQNPLAYGSTTQQPVYNNAAGTVAGLGLAAGSLFGSGGLFSGV